MASVRWEIGTPESVMTTELNSLADAGRVLGSEINNTTNFYLFDDVELYIAALGFTPAVGSVVELYLIRRNLDDGAYEDGDASITPPSTNLVGTFNIRNNSAAQTHIIRQIPLPPSKYKYLVVNGTGGTLASSGNILKHLPYRYQT